MKNFTITRDNIVTKSITATYMLNDTIGYMRIKSFGEATYTEMLSSLAQLNAQGMKGLVIDLRDNGGGYLQAAVNMANEFLPKDRLISSIRRAVRVRAPTIRVTVAATSRICRSSCSSTRGRHHRQRYSPEPCRTTTVPLLSGADPSVRALYSSRLDSPTVV